MRREEEGIIGYCQLILVSPVGWGERFNIPLLGYVLHPNYWGYGHATEAARAILRFAFVDLALPYVCADGTSDNMASRRVLEKAGLTFQGIRADFPGAPLGSEGLVYLVDSEDWLARFGGSI